MKQEWKAFIATLPCEVIFIHKDEFQQAYPSITLAEPGLVQISEDQTTTLLDAHDFQNIQSLDQLKTMVSNVVKKGH